MEKDTKGLSCIIMDKIKIMILGAAIIVGIFLIFKLTFILIDYLTSGK